MIKRIIPCLLYSDYGLVKTKCFKSPTYIGDPINAVKIFNEKEVDELIFLDISNKKGAQKPNFQLISDIASEAFMPMCYGGGVSSIEEMKTIYRLGIEKISLNSVVFHNPNMVREACKNFGSSSVVGSIDYKKDFFGNVRVKTKNGSKWLNYSPVECAKYLEDLGVGEILLTSIDLEGSMSGYDLEWIEKVSQSVKIPVIANGGAGNFQDFEKVFSSTSASAVSAGSVFVYYGKYNAVLINYPDKN